MNLSIGWSPWELALVPESRVEEIGVMLDEGKQLTGERFFELIDEVRIQTLRCPNCDRVWLKESPNKYASYVREFPKSDTDPETAD